MANGLIHSTSPYLLQHADNPVHWQEWGPAALAEAKERDVPIFLSIGYAACHWCHVMARESFSDETVAELVNRTSVPIKVDREERPDLDAVYMTATVAMTGQGGWPMSVWLTPQGQPFHAGTYFPPEPHHGLPSFGQVVSAVAEAWQDRRDEVRAGATDIAAQLVRHSSVPPPGALGAAEIDQALITVAESYDSRHPGFGTLPKFPPSMVLDFLVARASQDDGDLADRAWTMARDTCAAMADGGLFDQLGGGFARYCVDRDWTVPHFEKMLYDNALLLPVYARAVAEGQRRGDDVGRFCEVATRTAEWVTSEMTTPQGAFASSLDADSDDAAGEHREGAYYAWRRDELTEVLGDQADAASRGYRVGAEPNFEHEMSVLQRDPAIEVDDQVRRALLEHRERTRSRPGRDDKVITSWNGWMIAALAETGLRLGRADWVHSAITAGQYVLVTHRDPESGRLLRTSRDGQVSTAPAVAEDHAALAHGCLVLLQATADSAWLTAATDLLDELFDRFGDGDGGLYDTAADGEPLYLRPRELAENATPSASSAALRACRILARITGERRWDDRADALLTNCAGLALRAPRAAGWALADAVHRHGRRPAVEIALVDPADTTPAEWSSDLVRTAWQDAPAGSVIIGAPEGARTGLVLLEGRDAQGGQPTAYVCQGHVCQRPVTDVTDLQVLLGVQGSRHG